MAFFVACTTTSASPPSPQQAGDALFNRWCVGCHAVTANASPKLGPNLYNIATIAANNPIGFTPEAFLRESIIAPNTYITPGYMPNTMPLTYGQQFEPKQIDALVAYMMSLK